MAEASSQVLDEVDQQLSRWRQGDVAFPNEFVFLHLADLRQPLTQQAQELASELDPGVYGVQSKVDGLVVLTQTCDVVRPWRQRPFVEVSPLVKVPETVLEEVKQFQRPGYAWISAVSERRLVADLDRVMTVEKALVAGWHRIPGCATDREARQLAQALARKRSRTAFPEDFNRAVARLQQRIKAKHNRPASPEGRMLRAVAEIRVRAAPSWQEPTVLISFWFIKKEDPEDLRKAWNDQLEAWKNLVDWSGRFRCEALIACSLSDLTAQDYVESDPLDLDHLSAG